MASVLCDWLLPFHDLFHSTYLECHVNSLFSFVRWANKIFHLFNALKGFATWKYFDVGKASKKSQEAGAITEDIFWQSPLHFPLGLVYWGRPFVLKTEAWMGRWDGGGGGSRRREGWEQGYLCKMRKDYSQRILNKRQVLVCGVFLEDNPSHWGFEMIITQLCWVLLGCLHLQFPFWHW